MEPFAEPSDIVAVFRPLTTAETTLAEGLLAQVSNTLRLKARRRGIDLDALVAGDALIAEAVKAAVANAAKRVLMNPSAARQMSTTTGPTSDSLTVDSAVSSGALYLDPRDLTDVFPARSSIRSFRVRAGLI